jgi:signal transduction histidine kinase
MHNPVEETPHLHEFLATNREQILEVAGESLRKREPALSNEDLMDHLPEVLDQIIAALRRRAGLEAAPPDAVTAGRRVGSARQRRREPIGLVAIGIGAISVAVGEVGARAGVSFAAADYEHFNQTLDESTAAAIEEYAARERVEERAAETKRLGFLAHEMRNALGSGRMAFAALRRGLVGINSQTGDVLARSLTVMESLISYTLATVQLEAGIPVERRPVPIGNLCRQLLNEVAPDRGISIRPQLHDNLDVIGDERLLASIISNLLQNALKFTRAQGVVEVRARRNGKWVVVEIEDECGGLEQGQEQRILAPFVQLGPDRRGLGLGLAIAREAAEALGGRLQVRNVPQKGCVFSLEMPVS